MDIHEAVQARNFKEVKKLIEEGVNVGARDGYGLTPLHRAVRNEESTKIVELLLQAGANANAECVGGYEDDGTPLHYAADRCNVKAAKLLIENGANVDATTPEGYTPLHNAAMHNYWPFVELLIAHGADLNKKLVNDGWTALKIAEESNYKKTAAMLRKHGAQT